MLLITILVLNILSYRNSWKQYTGRSKCKTAEDLLRKNGEPRSNFLDLLEYVVYALNKYRQKYRTKEKEDKETKEQRKTIPNNEQDQKKHNENSFFLNGDRSPLLGIYNRNYTFKRVRLLGIH